MVVDFEGRLDAGPYTRRDWQLICLLVLLVLPIRCWLLYNTEVTARDSVGYIRYALMFDSKPWAEVWSCNDQHPGYPLAIWAVSRPLCWYAGPPNVEIMQFSAQLVSLISSLLLILPMYSLGKRVMGQPIGFWGSLLYQYWPVSSHHLSDGVSEPLFLLLLTSALVQAVRGVQGREIWRFALCGLITGLSYLVRPEGALIVPCALAALTAQQCLSTWRVSWKRFVACGMSLALMAIMIGSIYVVATGKITNKLSALQVIHRMTNWFWQPAHAERGKDEIRLAVVGTLPIFAANFKPSSHLTTQGMSSVMALVAEFNQGFHYVGSLPAMIGLFWSIGSLGRKPGYWVLCFFCAFHTSILIALALSVSYISDRHVMSLVMLGSFHAAYGFRLIITGLFALLKKGTGTISSWRSVELWSSLLMVGVIAFCLPRTCQRLHGNRLGNHEAGLWLAQQIRWGMIHPEQGDMIEDDHSWSHFYSGQLFDEGKYKVLDKGVQPRTFVVLTHSKDTEEGSKIHKDDKIEYRWPAETSLEEARVIIVSRPRNKASNHWQEK